ncbi:MAG: TlpA family protein disulfide reductase [Chloroflexi bacterium]|nr:TlpA family protein disulfide reductase [Chloroflexota bacterium]
MAGAAIFLVALGVGFTRDPTLVSSPLVGRPAPAFTLVTLTGETMDLSRLRGRPVVLNFWASWCLPCRDEAPLLVAADTGYRSQGLQVVGVIYQDSAANARAFMARYGQTYPGLLDPDGRTALNYGVFGIPETFFIDRDGIIVTKKTGQLDAASLRTGIEAILK